MTLFNVLSNMDTAALLSTARAEGLYPAPFVDRTLARCPDETAQRRYLARYILNRREDRRQGRRFAAMEAAGWGRRTPR